MTIDPLSAAFSIGKVLIEKIWPDPAKQAEELRKLEELRQNGDLAELTLQVQILTGQMDINKTEAQHKSIFVAGWRPFVGWVGGVALAYQFVLYPLLLWIWFIAAPADAKGVALAAPPIMDTSALYTLLLGMLGIGGMRSFDKVKGTATQSIGNGNI